MAKIIIKWKPQICGCACKFDVYIMNTYIGTLSCGGTVEAAVGTGSHMLSFKQKSMFGKKMNVSFVAVVNDDAEIVKLKTRFVLNGNFAVDYADNAPHIPTYGSFAANNAYTADIKAIGSTNKIPFGVQKQRKSNMRIIGYCVCAVVILFGFLLNNLVEFSDSKTTSVKNAQNTEMTDEEKSQQELEKAAKKFSDGDYRNALDICNSIKTQYPDTAAARNMDNYISEQYKQYPSFNANQLMAEYESNIVNADKNYTGKTVIVSGIINSFGKTNHDSNLCVLLKSGEYFKSVQLNFNTSQTDAVAALKEGASIKVIGKCSGKSGKQLLIFDGENVMIEDCLII